jgi:hypothetical protein
MPFDKNGIYTPAYGTKMEWRRHPMSEQQGEYRLDSPENLPNQPAQGPPAPENNNAVVAIVEIARQIVTMQRELTEAGVDFNLVVPLTNVFGTELIRRCVNEAVRDESR